MPNASRLAVQRSTARALTIAKYTAGDTDSGSVPARPISTHAVSQSTMG